MDRDEQIRELLEKIAQHWCPKIYSPTCPEMAAKALALLKEQPCKEYTVTQCSTDKCPFKIMMGSKLHCQITRKVLTSMILPFPEHCPLKGNRIVVKEEQPCKTCGGSGTVDTVPAISGLDNLTERDVPCPDCKEKKGE